MYQCNVSALQPHPSPECCSQRGNTVLWELFVQLEMSHSPQCAWAPRETGHNSWMSKLAGFFFPLPVFTEAFPPFILVGFSCALQTFYLFLHSLGCDQEIYFMLPFQLWGDLLSSDCTSATLTMPEWFMPGVLFQHFGSVETLLNVKPCVLYDG